MATTKGSNIQLIMVLFLTSRLMMLMAFPPVELARYGDYVHYFNLAQFSDNGWYPYLHYWPEYPPIFPYLYTGIYVFLASDYHNFVLVLASLLVLVECGNLYLLYRIALTLYGPQRATTIAWIYVALMVPVFFWLSNFDILTAFFVLLALFALVKNQSTQVGLALGLGTMVKLFPVMLLATVWRLRGFKAAVLQGGAVVLVSLLIFGPFFLLNFEMSLASVQSQGSKSSYETVWALIDGNYTTGTFGPLSDRLDPATATVPLHNPSRIPTWLTLIPFGALGLFLLLRPRTLKDENQDAIIFTALTFVIFFMWSKGWSPQWQTFLIPVLLLSLPERRAVLFIVALGFVNFLEWPVMLSRGLFELLPLTIITRTLIFAVLTFDLYRAISRHESHTT